jgi:uncharacterized membrane protein
MSTLELDDSEVVGRQRSPRQVMKESLITGAAIILPLAVTLLVLSFVVNFLSSNLSPISGAAVDNLPFRNEYVVQAIAVLLLVVVMLVVGFLAEFTDGGSTAGDQFDEFMASIPGLGSVYTSFNEMSELLLDSDTDSFQDVKLVQYPVEGSYTVAFKTADTPPTLERDTGNEEMVTLFMPMAPNPVMGGFVIHVSTDRVVDTDMTVEEGIRSIVTSGVAIGEEGPAMRGLTEEQMAELARIRRVEDGSQPESTAAAAEEAAERRRSYGRAVAPEHSETPDKIERRADRVTGDDTTPADIERGDGAIGDTAGTPAEATRTDERTRGTTPEPPAQVGGEADGRSSDDASGAPDSVGGADGNGAEDATGTGDGTDGIAGGADGGADDVSAADTSTGAAADEDGESADAEDWIPDEFLDEGTDGSNDGEGS